MKTKWNRTIAGLLGVLVVTQARAYNPCPHTEAYGREDDVLIVDNVKIETHTCASCFECVAEGYPALCYTECVFDKTVPVQVISRWDSLLSKWVVLRVIGECSEHTTVTCDEYPD